MAMQVDAVPHVHIQDSKQSASGLNFRLHPVRTSYAANASHRCEWHFDTIRIEVQLSDGNQFLTEYACCAAGIDQCQRSLHSMSGQRHGQQRGSVASPWLPTGTAAGPRGGHKQLT